MKKTILRILLWMGKFVGSLGIGYLFGSIANAILSRIMNEEFIEKHPFISLLLWVLAVVVASGAAILVITYPLTWVFEWFDKKIDDIEDDPFEKES